MSKAVIRPSKSSINKLGKRLREGDESEEALRLLDAYRELFVPPAREIVPQIESIAGSVSERVGKTTQAIVAKLRRQKHLQLAQMQDIAGGRVIVESIVQQSVLLAALRGTFPNAKFVDKRHDTGAYRAVHVIITCESLPFELQIRTEIQHGWAVLSEDLAAQYGSELKYGEGPEEVKEMLTLLSDTGFCEEMEMLDFPKGIGTPEDLILSDVTRKFRMTVQEELLEQEKHTS